MTRAATTMAGVAVLSVLATLGAVPAQAQPAGATAVTGVPQACPVRRAWPATANLAQVKRQLERDNDLALVGSAWTDERNRPLVQVVWQTLDAISCTGYLATITRNHPHLAISAGAIRGWAWGDWGLTRPGAVTLDFAKWHTAYDAGDRGRLVRLLVHELGHVYSQTPQAAASYARFQQQYRRTGQFSSYGNNVNENFSEVLGYYVARCAAGNPYDARNRNRGGRFDAYYSLVRDGVFGGREFGPPVGTSPDCRAADAAPRRVLPSDPGVTRVPKEALDWARPN